QHTAIYAQRAPPIMPAMSAPANTKGEAPAGKGRRKPVAKIAPRMICPSIPIFQRPGAKVRSNAEEQRTRGIQTAIVWASFAAEPIPPAKRIAKVCSGGAPETRRMSVVKTSERKTAAANRPTDRLNLAA
ncbi:unnamed protein product, partial [marine sediment metagenome]